MQRFEYRVVPAPRKGKKAKGLRSAEARFAHAVSEAMNDMAADGWEYLRADTLPCEERAGLTSKTTTFQTLLVFRRAVDPGIDMLVTEEEVAEDLIPAEEPDPDDTDAAQDPGEDTTHEVEEPEDPSSDEASEDETSEDETPGPRASA